MARQYVTNVRRYPPDVPLVVMDASIGLIHLCSPASRTTAPSFRTARDLLGALPGEPMHWWGVAFLGLGAALAVALWTTFRGRPRLVGVVRTFGPALFVMWALMYLLSGLHDVRASFLGVPPYLYLAYRHHFAPASPLVR